MNFQIADKSTEIKANWDDARLYCFSLGEGWRLPTKDELNQIYQSENDFEKYYYWSSTENNGDSAWRQGFYNGSQGYYLKSNVHSYVRAIRSLA